MVASVHGIIFLASVLSMVTATVIALSPWWAWPLVHTSCPAQAHPGVPGSASSPVLLPGKVGSRPIPSKELFVIHHC